MRKIISRLFLILCVVLVTACQTVPLHHTASGKPEVTIQNRSIDEIKSALINTLLNGNYTVTKDTNYSLTFERSLEGNIGAQLLFGSKYDSVPIQRLMFNLVKIQNDTRIVTTVHVVTNPGSAFERINNVTNTKDALDWQKLLNQMKTSMDAPHAGAAYLGIQFAQITSVISQKYNVVEQDGLLIIGVTKGGPAEQSGLKQGDVIKSIDGELSKLTNIRDILGNKNADDVSSFVLSRDGEEMIVDVTLGSFPAVNK